MFRCGARCDYATRDAHLASCHAFKEAWEEALRRLVEEFTAAQVRRYLSRMSQYKLATEAANFCALAETLNTQGEESKADGNASGVTDTALVELREGLFAVLASGQVPIAIIAPPAAR